MSCWRKQLGSYQKEDKPFACGPFTGLPAMAAEAFFLFLDKKKQNLAQWPTIPSLRGTKQSLHDLYTIESAGSFYHFISPPRLAFPAMAAEAFFLFLDKKKQKSSQQRGFFAARGLCPANKVKPRAVIFLRLLSRVGLRFSKKLLCPCLRTVRQFYLISSEAYLLTGGAPLINCSNKKKRKGLPKNAGHG